MARREVAFRAQDYSVRNPAGALLDRGRHRLALGIEQLVDVSKAGVPIRAHALPAYLTLLVVLIPFYHGAVRPLADVYLEKEGRGECRAELKWVFINLVAVPVIATYLVLNHDGPGLSWGVPILFFLRTDADTGGLGLSTSLESSLLEAGSRLTPVA